MSVDTGMPQPAAAGPPALKAAKISAGRASPPTAPRAGTITARGLRSSPTVTSRLISRPTTAKNTAIAPSFTQCRRSSDIVASPTSTAASVSQKVS